MYFTLFKKNNLKYYQKHLCAAEVLHTMLINNPLFVVLSCFTVPLCFYYFTARGVTYLFDIQAKTFNHVYDGEDVIAQARTGTGKTFSFAIPLVEKLQKDFVNIVRGRSPKVNTRAHIHRIMRKSWFQFQMT